MTAHAASNIKRLPALDLLRFAAALGVLLYHYVSSFPSANDGAAVAWLNPVTRYGYLGVNLFFMISGFVILWSAMGRSAVSFAISRASRLYPSFWVSVAFSVLCIVMFAGYVSSFEAPPLDVRTVAANLTMVPAIFDATLIDDVYWTLEMEIRFYALIGLLLLLRQMRHIEVFVFVWLGVSVLALFFDLPWVVRYVSIAPYGSFFVAGCLFFLVMTRGFTATRIAGLGVAAAASAYAALLERGGFLDPDRASAFVVPVFVLICFIGFAVIVSRKERALATPLADRLGALTYPLYLTHGTMGVLVYGMLRPTLGVVPTVLTISALAIAIAWLLTVTVDIPVRRPMSKLLHSWARVLRLSGERATAETP